ncbi:hypothetical protein S40288_06858 [Stachybotrys chartarum IBT 40288]|nr:hypothetical protein S40288_06858 [Stachybotrys chartarum IBT 40288]
MTHGLADMPIEVLLAICEDDLLDFQDLVHLSCCRVTNYAAERVMYEADLDPKKYRERTSRFWWSFKKNNCGKRAAAISWAVKHNYVPTLEKAMKHGGGIHIDAAILPGHRFRNPFNDVAGAATLEWYSKPLYESAATGSDAAVLRLIELGVPVDSPVTYPQSPGTNETQYELTPLFAALAARHSSTANLLLDHGANRFVARVVEQDNGSGTPARPASALHVAVYTKMKTVISRLLKEGLDVDAEACRKKVTPLHMACRAPCPCLRTIQALLNRGADVNKADDDGITPLNRAAQGGINYSKMDLHDLVGEEEATSLAAVSALLAAGADVNGRRYPPLRFALVRRAPEIIRALLKAGADATVSPSEPNQLFEMSHLVLNNGRGFHNGATVENISLCANILLDAGAGIDYETVACFLHLEMFEFCEYLLHRMASRPNNGRLWKLYFTLRRTEEGHQKAVLFLIKHAPPPIVNGQLVCDAEAERSWMSLFCKVIRGPAMPDEAVVNMLCDAFSTPLATIRNHDLLHHLLRHGYYHHSKHFRLVKAIVGAGLPATHKDASGNTCLHQFFAAGVLRFRPYHPLENPCSVEDFDELLDFLCDNGLDITKRNNPHPGVHTGRLALFEPHGRVDLLFGQPKICASFRKRVEALTPGRDKDELLHMLELREKQERLPDCVRQRQ